VKKLPNADLLRKTFRYDPSTGLLWWREFRRGCTMRKPAGAVETCGYRVVCLDGIYYKQHRLIWKIVTGRDPKNELDHKDLNKQNNRWKNLREATHNQNLMNALGLKTNRSGHTGVSWNARDKRWTAYVGGSSNRVVLGNFKHLKEAVIVRQAAAKKHFGEFARAR